MAFVAVAYLKHQIDCLQSHPLLENILPKARLELFHDQLSDLQSVLDRMMNPPQSCSEDVDPASADVMLKIGDLIVSFISLDGSLSLALHGEFKKVRQEISSLIKMLKIEDEEEETEEEEEEEEALILEKSVNWKTVEEEINGGKKKIFGLDKELNSLQEFVNVATYQDINVMWVVGMAGIGKTTLVKQVYYDSFSEQYFDDYLFLPIGPQYELKEILLLALEQLGITRSEKKDDQLLSRYVYECLVDSRYLIVLDDIWDAYICEELLRVFPIKRKQSRIILTSRRLDLSFPFLYEITRPYKMQIPFLDDDQSWNLLHEMVFNTQHKCDRQLEKIGRKIAKKCEGLPLAIIQVAEHLCKIGKTVKEWKVVAEREDPIIVTSDDKTPLSKAICLSYTMLPPYLKVCFLYMGVFPKKYKISRQKLIKLWVSEGFLVPRHGKSLEEVAASCLEELISQSVVLNTELSSIDMSGSKISRLHFTFRNVCVHEAKREKIFPIIKTYNESLPEDMDGQQRLCFHNNVVHSIKQVRIWMESVPDACSLLCFGPKQQYPVELYLGFRLLKVLEALAIRFYELPQKVVELVHLRYLTITCDGELPPSISNLLKLEVLIIHRQHSIKTPNVPVYLPIEIWNLLELKHLEFMGFDLPEPPADDDALILRKLLTLSGVSTRSCTLRVLARMPNLMKLGILIESAHDAVETLSFLDDFATLYEEFKSFKFMDVNPNLQRPSQLQVVRPILCFPINIEKITLSGCGFSWERIGAIAALPNLIVLKLRWYAFCGPDWEIGVADFPRLRFLLLEDLDLQGWKWEKKGSKLLFRELKGLIIRHCYNFTRNIPTHLEYTLDMIEVDDCSSAVALWARKTKDERSKSRYEDRMRTHSSWEDNYK